MYATFSAVNGRSYAESYASDCDPRMTSTVHALVESTGDNVGITRMCFYYFACVHVLSCRCPASSYGVLMMS